MDTHHERLIFHLLRQVESLGYHVAKWPLASRQEIQVGGDEWFIVMVQGESDEAMYRAAVDLAGGKVRK